MLRLTEKLRNKIKTLDCNEASNFALCSSVVLSMPEDWELYVPPHLWQMTITYNKKRARYSWKSYFPFVLSGDPGLLQIRGK